MFFPPETQNTLMCQLFHDLKGSHICREKENEMDISIILL